MAGTQWHYERINNRVAECVTRLLWSAKAVLLAQVTDPDGNIIGSHRDKSSCDSIMVCDNGELFHVYSRSDMRLRDRTSPEALLPDTPDTRDLRTHRIPRKMAQSGSVAFRKTQMDNKTTAPCPPQKKFRISWSGL